MSRSFGLADRQVIARTPDCVTVRETLIPMEGGPFVVMDDSATWLTRESRIPPHEWEAGYG